MSQFLSRLAVEDTEGSKARWRLLRPLSYYSSSQNKLFTVPMGFETDFASVPRIPLVYEAVGDTAHEAATLHDCLYTFQPVDRKTADDIFREAAIASGVSRWRAFILWAGVRIGGNAYWKS